MEEESAGRFVAEDGVREGVEDGGDKVGEERVGVVLGCLQYLFSHQISLSK